MYSTQKISSKSDAKLDKKEILDKVLKQLIEKKLSRLEKRNITEVKAFQTLSTETKDLILSLENMSQNVRKQICVQRQKYLNIKTKLTKTKQIAKKDSRLLKKNLKLRKVESRSFEKKDHHLGRTSEEGEGFTTLKSQVIRTPKSKSKGKRNLIIDSKKINNNISNKNIKRQIKPKRNISPFCTDSDKLSKTTMNLGIGKGRETIRKPEEKNNKSLGKRNILSKKEGPKNKLGTKYSNVNNNNPSKNNEKSKNLYIKNDKNKLNNVNILDKHDSNSLDSSGRQTFDFSKTSSEINNEINNQNNNKITEEKSDLDLGLTKNIDYMKSIKIDDKYVDDPLLVTNNLDGDIVINMDNCLGKGSISNELNAITTNTTNNNIPDPNKKDIDTDKNDKNEEPSKNDKDTSKKETLKSSLLIYNKLKRTKITFLEGEKDFDLIFKDSKIEDMDLEVNLGKDVDLNTTVVSEQMGLDEKLETNLDIISRYLDIRDICNLMIVNKECFKTLINILISKTEISIELLEEEINKLKETYNDINFYKIIKKPFCLSVNSMRAISLLNTSSGKNILALKPEQLNKKEIALIYSLYFVAIGKKKDIISLDDLKKIEYIQKYFKDNCVDKISFGKFIEKELNGIIFDDNVISTIYRLSKNYLDIISPNHFQIMNKDIAIFVFIIRDLLEHLGLLGNRFQTPENEYILLNARLNSNKAILKELNLIEENIN